MSKRYISRKNNLPEELKHFIICKFGNRFDLSELDGNFYRDDKKKVYKIIDTWTDNIYFKTSTQIKCNFNPPTFKKKELLDEIIKIFGNERFDFTKSIVTHKCSTIEVYDNYLKKTFHRQIKNIKKMAIISKPDRENMIMLLKKLPYICKLYDVDNIEYFSHDVPMIIKNFKTGSFTKFSLQGLIYKNNRFDSCIEKKKGPEKGTVNRTDQEIFDKLVKLYPTYIFDINNLFSFKLTGKKIIKNVIYTDLTNGETYSHQSVSAMFNKHSLRSNHKARSKEQVINQLKKEYLNIDIDSIIFPESPFNYSTEYFLTTRSIISYRLIGGFTKHQSIVSNFFQKTRSNKRNKIVQKDVIQKVKDADIYNNFDFSELTYIDGIDNITGDFAKKFKIYNKITKTMIYSTLENFKSNISKRLAFREDNRNNYIYLDRSDTTRKGHVDIICPSHGNFSQWSKNHFMRGDCCPLCNASTGETKIYQYFNANEIKFDFKYKAHKLMKLDYLRFDFYLPEFDIYIQYNGEHHHKTVQWANSLTQQDLDDNLRQEQLHDEMKFEYCKKNNLNYIVLNYWQLDNLEVALEEELYKLIESRKI